MNGKFVVFILAIFCSSTCVCQNAKPKTYNWSWDKDGAVLASSIAGYAGSRYLISQNGTPSLSAVRTLDFNTLPSFDRGAIFNSSHDAAQLSDMFLFGSFALPFISFLDKNSNSQKGVIFGMMFETLLINTNITNTFKGATTRFRPYAYNLAIHEDVSITSTTQQSFISGHTSTVAATSFFTAKVLTDMNPDSQLKPLIWASAFVVPAITGYLRYSAGKHFPSDIVAGYGVGALIGFFVPHFHKINHNDNVRLGVLPVAGGLGLSANMNLNGSQETSTFIEF